MKRILSVLMILTIIVSMTACADSKINEPDIIEHDAPLSSSSENISDTENESNYISISQNENSENASDEMKSYLTSLTPIFKIQSEKIKENRKLAQIRDTILPKLMSGEIKL